MPLESPQSGSLSPFHHTRYFPALDGLRAVAVLLVFFNHLHAQLPRGIYGELGVDIFFVLSGFLISTLLLRERAATGRILLRAFLTRRVFRILPAYLVTVLLYACAVRLAHDPEKQGQFRFALPWLLSFLPEYRPAAAGNVFGHAWTLGVEEKFYLLWPLLLPIFLPLRRRWAGLSLLLFIVLIVFALALAPAFYTRTYGALLVGALLALVLHLSPEIPRLPPLFVLLLFLALAYFLAGTQPHLRLLFPLAIALLLASLVTRTSLPARMLSHPAALFVGRRSYAMYLLHVLVLDTLASVFPALAAAPWPLLLAAGFLLTLLFAALLHAALEQPMIRLGHRLSRRLGAAAPASRHPNRA